MREVQTLGPWLRRFFDEHLVSERNLSRNTRASYRDTFGCRSHTDNGNQQLTGNRTRLYDTMSVKWHR